MIEQTGQHEARIGRYGGAGLLVGIIAIAATGVMMFNASTQTTAFQSYVFSFAFWMSMTLGCFGLTLLHHICKGTWGLPVLRLFEAGGGPLAFVVMFIIGLPILGTVLAHNPVLYHWASPDIVSHDTMMMKKAPYLNPTFFAIRFVAAFLIWFGLAALLRRSGIRQDETKDLKEEAKRSNWASPGLVAFFVMAIFVTTDWFMSLDAHWWSTMYAPWFAVSAGLGSLAFVTAIAAVQAEKEPYKAVVNHNLLRDLGNLLLAFTMLWAYTSLSQYLIIWSGNLPETTRYYVRREEGGWNGIGMALILGQFFFPFLMLLIPRTKAVARRLAFIAGWILVMHFLDMYQTILPEFAERVTAAPILTDLLAFLAIGGFWLAAFSATIRKAPLLPVYDPRILETEHAH